MSMTGVRVFERANLDFRGVGCAVCQKPVDSVECYYDVLRCETVYVIRCHGAEESATVRDADFVLSRGVSFDGEAFTRKAIA